jgi:hypothetical protein
MTTDSSNTQRRALLQAATALAVSQIALTSGTSCANETKPQTSNKPKAPTPGKPGDFDFLIGNWKIKNRHKRQGQTAWDEYVGESTCWTILGGSCSIEELRIPARNFSGLGLRLLDVEKREWNDFWVNAKSGSLTTPGTTGSFENGAGIFISEDSGLWDGITKNSCRWSQSLSKDGGKTWDDIWLMEWTRA